MIVFTHIYIFRHFFRALALYLTHLINNTYIYGVSIFLLFVVVFIFMWLLLPWQFSYHFLRRSLLLQIHTHTHAHCRPKYIRRAFRFYRHSMASSIKFHLYFSQLNECLPYTAHTQRVQQQTNKYWLLSATIIYHGYAAIARKREPYHSYRCFNVNKRNT